VGILVVVVGILVVVVVVVVVGILVVVVGILVVVVVVVVVGILVVVVLVVVVGIVVGSVVVGCGISGRVTVGTSVTDDCKTNRATSLSCVRLHELRLYKEINCDITNVIHAYHGNWVEIFMNYKIRYSYVDDSFVAIRCERVQQNLEVGGICCRTTFKFSNKRNPNKIKIDTFKIQHRLYTIEAMQFLIRLYIAGNKSSTYPNKH
jgi:hypothetical protein